VGDMNEVVEAGAPRNGRIRVDCAVCKDIAQWYTVTSDLDQIGEIVTFTVECHGARETIEWKPPPMVLGPLVDTAFMAGDASPLSHLGEWRGL
jgi:hypothetical protein